MEKYFLYLECRCKFTLYFVCFTFTNGTKIKCYINKKETKGKLLRTACPASIQNIIS